MRRRADPTAVCALLAVAAMALFAGCSGHTTGASQIEQQPDGTYSAKLNAIGSCDEGSPSTPCKAYTRWRRVGTNAWTNGPTVTVPRKLSNVNRSQRATGLSPNTNYEYQVCGKEFVAKSAVCVGPDRTDTNSTEKFVTGSGSAAGGKTSKEQGGTPSGAATSAPGTQTTPSGSASNSSSGSNGVGSGGETSPWVPIAIGVVAGLLVLGGIWWASRRRATGVAASAPSTSQWAPTGTGPDLKVPSEAESGAETALRPTDHLGREGARIEEELDGEHHQLSSAVDEADRRPKAEREQAMEDVYNRLQEAELRVQEAEQRAADAERLAQLKVEEAERERRLRKMLERVSAAEASAKEAEGKARVAEASAARSIRAAEEMGVSPTPTAAARPPSPAAIPPASSEPEHADSAEEPASSDEE